MISTIW